MLRMVLVGNSVYYYPHFSDKAAESFSNALNIRDGNLCPFN